MRSFYTLGFIPILKDSKLRVYSIVDTEKSDNIPKESVKLLDDYLDENPITFSGLSEFQAVHQAIGYCPKKGTQRDTNEYILTEIDPSFKIGSFDKDKVFSKSVESEPIKRISFSDIQDYIDWIQHPEDKPKLLKEFETIDGYNNVMTSAISALSNKLISDYRFNELVNGLKGGEVKGVISVKEDNGDLSPSINKKFSTDNNSIEDQKREAYTEGYEARMEGRDDDSFVKYKDNSDLVDSWKKGYEDCKQNRLKMDKNFSAISLPNPDTRQYSLGNFIGTIAEAYKFIWFFHWQTRGIPHLAFQDLYDAIHEPIDSIVEKILSTGEGISSFTNEVFPKGDDIDYLRRLKNYVVESVKLLFGSKPDASSYQSIMDDMINAIDSCIFRLQIQDGSSKTFSIKH